MASSDRNNAALLVMTKKCKKKKGYRLYASYVMVADTSLISAQVLPPNSQKPEKPIVLRADTLK